MENINWLHILYEIIEVCIIPLLSILTFYLVQFIKSKVKKLQKEQDNELAAKYIGMLGDTITNCVLATQQTYVETLKKEGSFDVEAQKKAFDMTKKAILQTLNKETTLYLNTLYGDLASYLDTLIEAEVKRIKIIEQK